jgi:hypothetical protein
MHEGYFSSCAVAAEHGRGATQLRLFLFLWLLLCAPRGRARTKAAKGHARPPRRVQTTKLEPAAPFSRHSVFLALWRRRVSEPWQGAVCCSARSGTVIGLGLDCSLSRTLALGLFQERLCSHFTGVAGRGDWGKPPGPSAFFGIVSPHEPACRRVVCGRACVPGMGGVAPIAGGGAGVCRGGAGHPVNVPY